LYLKPEEEISKMTLQEDLSEADRIIVLLSKKDYPSTLQSYVFHNATNIFKGNPHGIQQAVIPIILKQLGTFGETI
jgi:spore coat polysaccharide biosynthesis protein SpsF (cytidylyltransferase family)